MEANPSLVAIRATRTLSFSLGPMDRLELARLLNAFAAQVVQREKERLKIAMQHYDENHDLGCHEMWQEFEP